MQNLLIFVCTSTIAVAAALTVMASSFSREGRRVALERARARGAQALVAANNSIALMVGIVAVADYIVAVVTGILACREQVSAAVGAAAPLGLTGFVFASGATVAIHGLYRSKKTLVTKPVWIDGTIRPWRQPYSELMEILFTGYDRRCPRALHWFLGKLLRPYWSLIPAVGILLLLSFGGYSAMAVGACVGLGTGKLLYAFTLVGRRTRELLDLRKDHCCYILIRNGDRFLATVQADPTAPFYGLWCLPLMRLEGDSSGWRVAVASKANDLLQVSGCGLTLRRLRYALKSTFMLYDRFTHEHWQTAHLFVCETDGAAGTLAPGFSWLAANEHPDTYVEHFVGDALRMDAAIEDWDPGSGYIRYWWRAPIVPNLANRPQ